MTAATKFHSVEAFLAARDVWRPDASSAPDAPPTVPESAADAARRFECSLLSVTLDGADCAARSCRVSARKDAATLCHGCAAGEARAELLDVTIESLEQKKTARKRTDAEKSRAQDKARVARLNQRVTAAALRRPVVKALAQRPASNVEAARTTGRKVQATGEPRQRKKAGPAAAPMKRRPRRATQPAKRIDWSKVDLTRDPQELVEELGCARQAVYHARRRYLDRTPRAPLGKGWRRRSALIVASPFCTSVVGRRLLRLVEAGDAERTMIGRESWYRPVTDAGRDAFRRLLAGEASPTFDVPDGYDISKPPQVVADELGCSLSTARRLRKRAGVGLGRRIDWDRVDLTRDVHDLTAELGVGADSVYSQRRKRGVTVRPARPDGDGWYSIAELHQASDKAHVTIQRRAIQMARGGDLDVVKAGVRKFYRPATPTGREWLRDLFDSRPRVARESVREAADGVLDMLVKAGAVERRGSTNDTVWRVNDAEAVRRAGLQVEQRGGLS